MFHPAVRSSVTSRPVRSTTWLVPVSRLPSAVASKRQVTCITMVMRPPKWPVIDATSASFARSTMIRWTISPTT